MEAEHVKFLTDLGVVMAKGASDGFDALGRGLIIVDFPSQPGVFRAVYHPIETLRQLGFWPEAISAIESYDPATEYVVVLIVKSEGLHLATIGFDRVKPSSQCS